MSSNACIAAMPTMLVATAEIHKIIALPCVASLCNHMRFWYRPSSSHHAPGVRGTGELQGTGNSKAPRYEEQEGPRVRGSLTDVLIKECFAPQ